MLSAAARRCRRHFLSYFPDGFRDETYLETERAYKWHAHRAWSENLDRRTYERLLDRHEYREVVDRVLRIEGRTNLLFSFEKMALRDATRCGNGAEDFAVGLYGWIFGPGSEERRFVDWCHVVAGLPRRQTRVLTWPIVTVFGFLARPRVHVLLKPNVTRSAAVAYDVEFPYESRPQWETYASLLAFARRIRQDQRDLGPRDMIDAQSFIWTLGSPEYE
jgi:hypothetical protein